MNLIDDLQAARNSLICEIDSSFGRLIEKLSNGDTIGETETITPLSADPSRFRGTKPVAVLFGDERIAAPTWKKVFEVILRRCVQDSRYREHILGLRDKAAGKIRVFLSHSPDGMRRPVEIDSGVYAETHYGSETLMHILCKRLLEPVHFDCSAVRIVIRT